MFNNRFKFDATAELAKSILEADTKAKMEELKGKQVKLDKNHNGKLDAQDFKMLRGEKKVNEQGVAEGLNEMDKSAPQPGRDGKVSHSTYGSRDKKGSDYFKGKEAPGKPITKKEMEKDVLDILKKQGVAEGSNDDELNARPGMWRGKADMAKRMTKKGEPTKAEKDFQDNLKNRIKASNRQGGLTGPKGVLPEEQGVAEDNVNEAEADYQSSYRVGKVANFKPKVSDVGQGRKITGKMGKYGKQPDDDNMVEPPPEHKVGDVKTDPSAVVPGHSTMGAKLHLASLPKDAEGNTIHKGARRINAADLVAKRKAMMSGQKNEEYVEEGMEDTLHPAGAALLKHIKPQHHNLYKPHLTKDVFKGSYGDRTSVLKAAKDAGHLKMDLKKQNEDVEELDERELTSGETAEKERIVHGMKKSLKGFKARYGDRAKEVMYATATKQAKKD